ncbi:MAG: RIP metalloprotease RseP [Moraxellaceae bacterium]|nr:RIP metalloprotease RseP [Pseudobdellovibrionaceae bacterium]
MNISDVLNAAYSNIVPFVLLLGILVFVHEFGHFIVARMCGVKVEVFSLGFGKKILQYKSGDTNYCLSLIPFGGYVKMYGEQGGEVVPEDQRHVSFTHKSVWKRISIVLAGPLMNLLFAILVFGGISYFGEETRAPKIADVQSGSAAEQAGLKAHDTIVSVGGVAVRSYEEFQNALTSNKNTAVAMVVKQTNEPERNLNIKISSMKNPNIFSTEAMIGEIAGILPYAKGSLVAVKMDSLAYRLGFRTGDEIVKIDGMKVSTWTNLTYLVDGKNHDVKLATGKDIQFAAAKDVSSIQDLGFEEPELYLDQVVADSPASKADIQAKDKILAINAEPMKNWDAVLNKIKSYDGKEALSITLLREGVEVTKKVTPLVTSQMTAVGKEDRRYTIGIVPMVNFTNPETVKVAEPSIFAALSKGAKRSYDISAMTVISFVRMFQGEVSHKNIGGMISIGKAAKDSYAMGAQAFLMTMGILSISLFILNLLPVPVLDGGHLVFYIIEVVKGSPLSVKKIEVAHQVGFALLMGLMVLALFNDFTKFLFKS